MYYQTPNVFQYVKFITRYRAYIIAAYVLLFFTVLAAYQPNILSSDAMFWLKDSAALKKTEARHFRTHRLSKLTVHVDAFDAKTREALQALNDRLSSAEGVDAVYSLFSRDLGETRRGGEGSETVGIVTAGGLDIYRLKKLVIEEFNTFGNVVDGDFRTFRFFISAQKPVEVGSLGVPGRYSYSATAQKFDWPHILAYAAALLLLFVLLFRYLFKNYIAALSGLAVIVSSTVFTFALIYVLTGINAIYITMPFITVSIVFVDFLYFYYRWHVSQYKIDKRNALIKMLGRNAVPALWTSVITALGLGSLVVLDSDIIRLLSLGVIVSSVVAYLVNLTFLPALSCRRC